MLWSDLVSWVGALYRVNLIAPFTLRKITMTMTMIHCRPLIEEIGHIKCIFSRFGMHASLSRMRCIGICRVSYFGSARDHLLSGIKGVFLQFQGH